MYLSRMFWWYWLPGPWTSSAIDVSDLTREGSGLDPKKVIDRQQIDSAPAARTSSKRWWCAPRCQPVRFVLQGAGAGSTSEDGEMNEIASDAEDGRGKGGK